MATRDRDVYEPAGLLGNFSADSDASFDRGEIISNRVDILSELDVIWNETLGFRVSGAGWYDHAYRNGTNARNADAGPFNNAANHSTGLSARFGELNEQEKFLHERGGELLDAFAFWNWELGDVVGNLRAGRHVIFWGQSLLGTASVASAGGAMNPLDFSKGLSVPGSEAKELFRPTNKISTLIQLTDELTMSAYYSLEWEATRLPTGNTLFSPAAGFTDDVDLIHAADEVALRLENDEEPGAGEWGVQFSYWFEDLAMEAQFYYLNYHDKIQNGLTACVGFNPLPPGGPALVDAGCLTNLPSEAVGPLAGIVPGVTTEDGIGTSLIGKAKWTYAEDVDLYGFSLAKQIGDISYGMDLTYRDNAPLRPNLTNILFRTVAPGSTFTAADYDAADEDDYRHATGQTLHLVVNALGLLSDNGFWEGGNYIIEATFGTLLDSYEGVDNVQATIAQSSLAADGRVSSDTNVDEDRITSHIAINFNPTWFQVMPGIDLTVRSSVAVGIDGNGTQSFAGDEESGSASLGVELLVDQAWTATLRYNAFFGPVPNGFGNLLKDRDNVALTFKRTF